MESISSHLCIPSLSRKLIILIIIIIIIIVSIIFYYYHYYFFIVVVVVVVAAVVVVVAVVVVPRLLHLNPVTLAMLSFASTRIRMSKGSSNLLTFYRGTEKNNELS